MRGAGRAGHWRRKLGDCRAFGEGPLADTLEYRGRSDLFRTREFHAGEFEMQDISSQAVGLICNPRPGEKWWDACAGEGGKTLHLAELMENQGSIWASDRARWRLGKLEAAGGASRGFQLSRGRLGRGAASADEDGIRWRAAGCAVQRHRNLAAEPSCTVDHNGAGREGTKRGADADYS